MLNTLVLLASSWFIARSVQAARAEDHAQALRLTYLGGLCGVAFIAIKAYEWSAKIAQGYTISSNDFFMFYYMLTGVHLFHVSLGLLILGITMRELRNLAVGDPSWSKPGPPIGTWSTCCGSSSSPCST